MSKHWAACKVVTGLAGFWGRIKWSIRLSILALAVSCSVFAQTGGRGHSRVSSVVPVADYHQHLCSPELAALIAATPPTAPLKTRTAADLITQLEAAGIRQAIVLSAAYIFEQPSRKADGAAEKLRRENDWTSSQVAQFPGRLIGFCSLNPLTDYAIDELARCASDPNLRRGLKLHFGNSVVDYHNPQHIAQVRRVIRVANDHRMTIVVHARASVTQQLPYGRDEALIFLNELLPAAPDVVVQLAHLAGSGPWEDQGAQQALSVFADAVAKGDPRTKSLYFDITTLGAPALSDTAQRWAAMIRQIGLLRIVFGSDATTPNVTPGGAWSALRELLPLTDEEFGVIATNVPPYMQRLDGSPSSR